MFMNILLLLLLAALVIAYTQRGKNPEQSKMIMTVLVVLVFAVLGIRWIGGCRRGAAGGLVEARDFHSAAGFKLGEHIASIVPDGGSLLVIQADPANPISRAQVSGLSKGAGNRFRVVTEQMRWAENEMEIMEGMWITMDMLTGIIGDHSGAAAVVSCLGLPNLAGGARPPANLPPLFAFDTHDPGATMQWMNSGVLKGSLIYKEDIDWRAKPERGMSTEQIFDMRFRLVTPDNYRELLRQYRY